MPAIFNKLKLPETYRLAFVIWVAIFAVRSLAENPAGLLTRHEALRQQLANNLFRRPLYMESRQDNSHLAGEIYAEIKQPYAVVGATLRDVNNWCDILILHVNIKSCRALSSETGSPAVSKIPDRLKLHIGRKTDMPLISAEPIDFLYRVTTDTSKYLQVELEAKEGPHGTSDYRIELEVTALDPLTSFFHFSYSYNFGLAAKLAMQGYLATSGRQKVGFTITGYDANGKPEYTGGMRGVIERNTMRYYLAIEAYLGSLSTPMSQQIDKRLNDWFTSTEQYSLQLHEIERQEYLSMKHEEIQRQSTPANLQ